VGKVISEDSVGTSVVGTAVSVGTVGTSVGDTTVSVGEVGTGTGTAVVGTAVDVGKGSAVVVDSAVLVGADGNKPPVTVGTAYGGSKRPNGPQALHGLAHDLIASGATRIGLQCPSGAAVARNAPSSL